MNNRGDVGETSIDIQKITSIKYPVFINESNRWRVWLNSIGNIEIYVKMTAGACLGIILGKVIQSSTYPGVDSWCSDHLEFLNSMHLNKIIIIIIITNHF